MSEERKTPVWPWVVALLIGLPVVYVASFGPACHLLANDRVSYRQFECIFRPLVYLTFNGPEITRQSLMSYIKWWNGRNALLASYFVDKLRK